MKYIILTILSIIMVAGCDLGPQSPRGFSLPEGNAEQGELVLQKYQCLSCHIIEDTKPLASTINHPDFAIRLGGKSTKVTTYAELLTSIINPSHKLAKGYPLASILEKGVSKMKIYNDVMTVSELVNLVTFLQGKYQLVPYRNTNYQYYGY